MPKGVGWLFGLPEVRCRLREAWTDEMRLGRNGRSVPRPNWSGNGGYEKATSPLCVFFTGNFLYDDINPAIIFRKIQLTFGKGGLF